VIPQIIFRYLLKTPKLFFEIIFLLTVSQAFAQSPVSIGNGKKTSDKLSETLGRPFSAVLNINNISMWASSNGLMEQNPELQTAGVVFPKGKTTVINAGGILWGGRVRDGKSPVVRVGGSTFKSGLQPGRIIAPGISENPENADVRIFRIRRDWATADLAADASETYNIPLFDVRQSDIDRLREQYRKDWLEWPWQKGAPYYERNGLPGYQPDASGLTDSLTDEPGIAEADQVLWFVCNDIDNTTAQALYGSPPVGLEIQITCWAYKDINNLDNVIFQRYRIIYKGTATTPSNSIIERMYLGKWIDVDIGNFDDDYVGCDVSRNLAYAYNSQSEDEEFSKFKLIPAVVGYDLLQGPRDSSQSSTARWNFQTIPGFRNLPLSSFTYFTNSTRTPDYVFGSYEGSQQLWNSLRGYLPKPISPEACLKDPFTNECTKFELTGDPQYYQGWNDGLTDPAGERRFLMSSGSFNLAYRDTQEVIYAVIGAIGQNNRDGIGVLKEIDDAVQDFYNLNFQPMGKLPAPNVRVVELDKKIILDWESDTTQLKTIETYNSFGFRFESYVLYQFPLPTSQIDEAVRMQFFDPTSPRYVYITEDKIRNKPLVNGQKYYFAVTASYFNPDPSFKKQRLESAIIIHEVIPHSPNPGVVYPYAIGDEVKDVKNLVGFNDAKINIEYYDPAKPDGHIYKIIFHRSSDPWTDITEKPQFTLIDTTVNDTLIKKRYVDDPPKRITSRGFSVYVQLPLFGLKGVYEVMSNNTPTLSPVFENPNPAGNHMVVAPQFSVIDTIMGGHPSDHDVELRFQGDSSWTLFWVSKALLSKWVRVPFTAWEKRVVGADTLYRQLYTTVIQQGPETTWAPWVDLGRDYNGKPMKGFYPIVILIDSVRYNYGWVCTRYEDDLPFRKDMPTLRSILWQIGQYNSYKVTISRAYFVDLDNDGEAVPPGTIVRFVRYKQIRNADEKIFSTIPLITGDLEAAKKEIEKINVFPNPYYGMNRAEIFKNQKFVTFNHLPYEATIKIFNLAGTLVKTIRKYDPSQFASWDLNNENGLQAAGGLYIAHIELNDEKGNNLGEKVLKLMIVPEDQSPRKD